MGFMSPFVAVAAFSLVQVVGRVTMPAGVPRGWVAEGGVPIARGVLDPGQDVGIVLAGTACRAEPSILWPDGSVRWLFLRLRAMEAEVRMRGGLAVRVLEEEGPALFLDQGRPPALHMRVIAADDERMEGAAGTAVPGPLSTWKAVGVLEHSLDPGSTLLSWDVFWRRMAEEVWVGEVTLRNDPIHDPPGRILVRGAHLQLPRGWHGTVAWRGDNGLRVEKDGGDRVVLLPEGASSLLGDGQTKTWRLWAGRRPPTDTDRRLLENPVTLVPTGEMRDTGAFGSYAQAPAGAERGNSQVIKRLRQTWKPGWNAAWGEVKNTHTTGSPRNGLFDEAMLRWAQTRDPAFLSVALPTTYQHALRPLMRELDADAVPRAFLAEGLPHHGSHDKLGRNRLDPALRVLRGPEPEGWLAEWNGWTGYDIEHLTVDRLWALYAVTGSRWMEREIQAVGESLLTWHFAKDDRAPGSVRGSGWALRTLAHCASLGDGAGYVRAMGLLIKHMDGLEKSHGKGWLNDNKGNARQIPDHRYTLPWQHAIVIYGLAEASEWLPADQRIPRMAGLFADFIAGPGWDEDSSRFYKAVATDGSGVVLREPSLRGTNCWIPPALVLADGMLPGRGYLEAARKGWEPVRDELRDWVKSKKQWHFIQPCLVALEANR